MEVFSATEIPLIFFLFPFNISFREESKRLRIPRQPRLTVLMPFQYLFRCPLGLEITGNARSIPKKQQFVFASVRDRTREISVGIRLVSSYVND